MDGWVTIGTKLDTKGLEQGLKKADSELKNYEKEAERLTTQKIKIDESNEGLQKDIQRYEMLTRVADKYHQKMKEINAQMKEKEIQATGQSVYFEPGYIKLASSMETLQQKEQEVVAEIDKMAPKIEDAYSKYEKNQLKVAEIGSKLQENKNKQTELNSKIGEMNSKLAQSKGFDAVRGSIDNINKQLSHTIGRVGRWIIGVFGVYSAYSAVRGAMNTLSQYNQQMATDIEYVRYALANTLKPVVEGIINLVVKLLQYINYIAKAWFGVNLFAGASAKDFKKAKDNASGIADNVGTASKKAKELKRQLAGFDEMNILNDNVKGDDSTGSGGSGVGSADIPSFDLGKDVEIPKWMKWIAEHKDEVIAGLFGIAGALTALKLGATLGKALGIGIAIGGITYAIEGLIKYLKDPSFDNFGQILQGISITVIGIGLAFGSLPLVIGGAIALVVATIIRYWNQIKEFLQSGIDWLTGKSDWVHKTFGNTIGGIYDLFVGNLQKALNWLDRMIKKIKENFDEVIKFVKNVFTGNWSGAWDNIKNIFSNIWDGIKDTFGTMFELMTAPFVKAWNKIKEVFAPVIDFFKSIFGTVYNNIKITIDNMKQIFTALWTAIKKVFEPVVTWFKDKFSKAWTAIKNVFSPAVEWFGNLWTKIKNKLKSWGTKVGQVIGNAFKSVINAIIRRAENVLNAPVNAINSLIGKINKLPGVSLTRLQTFSLPRLAKGGIVNMPGKGVPIGGAIAGEHGAEGVIPLTDSQQMAMLGEAIGKYITVNFTNITKLDNRQIAREQKTISAQSDFAFNR